MSQPPPRLPERLLIGPDGAQLFRGRLDRERLDDLAKVLAGQPQDQAGIRLFGVEGLLAFLGPQGVIGALAGQLTPKAPRPVRAILFDKSEATNWALGWHQDRVIAVQEKVQVDGFGPWTRKHGALHVTPPFEVLAPMLTLRVHLDPVPITNAPLLIAPGSHRFGKIAERDVPGLVQRCGTLACLAEAGDVWMYSTPILHASERSSLVAHRRVLQVDYAFDDLPDGLRWLGISGAENEVETGASHLSDAGRPRPIFCSDGFNGADHGRPTAGRRAPNRKST